VLAVETLTRTELQTGQQ